MKHFYKILYIILLQSGSLFFSFSQNLVPNSSFEQYFDCPKGYTPWEKANLLCPGWSYPTKGTPDLLNRCAKESSEVSVPDNFTGNMEPHTGDGYAGIFLVGSNLGYREYLQAELLDTLKKGKQYCVCLHWALGKRSYYAVNKLGVYFSNKITGVQQESYLELEPQIENPENQYLAEKNKWQEFSGIYTAKGNEKYMIIGNFSPPPRTQRRADTVMIQGMVYRKNSYYLIDDVSVVMKIDGMECQCGKIYTVKQPDTTNVTSKLELLKEGDKLILRNIFFEYDKATLLPESHKELGQVIDFMTKTKVREIEISGHTDGKGAELYNQRLSEARAKSVVDYLTSKGIDKQRLSYKGYGKAKPIADNDTDEGRKQNRRVEFLIKKK